MIARTVTSPMNEPHLSILEEGGKTMLRIRPLVVLLIASVLFLFKLGGDAAAQVPPPVEEVPLGALGVLPAPLAMPKGTPDQAAMALAKTVAAGGPQALPALLTALRASGFAIRGKDGKVQFRPTANTQGLAFDAWEVQALARLVSQGTAWELTEVGTTLASALQELKGAPMAKLIREDLRGHSVSPDSKLRFWARFVVALGTKAPHPRDILADTSANLDALQLALINRRLAADLWAFAGGSAPGAQTRQKAAAPKTSPCRFDGVQGIIMDSHAVVATTAFEKLLDYLEQKGMTSAGKIAKLNSLANLALAYAKAIYTYATFDIDVQMAQPLTRTTSTSQPGELRTLVVRLRFDGGPRTLEWANCLRPMLNNMGVDFDVPSSGPIEGAKVRFTFVKGGNPLIGPKTGIVQFAKGANPLGVITNAQGIASIGIDGTPQIKPISANAKPVTKTAVVYIAPIVKPSELFQDIVDATGTHFSGLLTLPIDIFERSPLSPQYYNFKVVDWEEPEAFKVDLWGSATWSDVGRPHVESASFKLTSLVERQPAACEFMPQDDGTTCYAGTYTLTASGTVDVRSNRKRCIDNWSATISGKMVGYVEGDNSYVFVSKPSGTLEVGQYVTHRKQGSDLTLCPRLGELARVVTGPSRSPFLANVPPGIGTQPWVLLKTGSYNYKIERIGSPE
jgi:hypothetical protein